MSTPCQESTQYSTDIDALFPNEPSTQNGMEEKRQSFDIRQNRDMDHRDAQRRVRMLNIGYGIALIGDIPSEINYTTTKWETEERIDAVRKNTFPDLFMLTTDIVHIHEYEAVTNPLDCTLFSEVEKIKVTVELPSVDDLDHKYLKYKAGVRFQKCWEFFDIEVFDKNKGVFRTDKIESLCVFVQAIKEKSMVSTEETQVGYVAAARNQHNFNVNVNQAIQAVYMCKILFFVRKQRSRANLMIMLECVELEKIAETIKTRKERYDFDIVKQWISKDMFMIPDRTVIKVDVSGKFSIPRGAKIKCPAISFNPYAKENFTRFQVDLLHRLGDSIFGILSLRENKNVIDEIFYNPFSHVKVASSRIRRHDRGDKK